MYPYMRFTTITVLIALLHFQRKIVQKLLHLMNVVEQKDQKKIAGHFFFHDTEFQMPKLNTGIIKAFLTYLPYRKEHITCKAYNMNCTLKFLRIKRNPATAILRASTCLQKK